MHKVIIIGAGVVGQATGKGLIKKGHKIVFVDKEAKVVDSLKRSGLRAYLPSDLPTDIDAEISMFCVCTPSKEFGSVDLSHIASAVAVHSEWLKKRKNRSKYHLIVIRSTVPAGTTTRLLLPLIEMHSNMKVGYDLGLCMQPEFLRAATGETDFLHPRITVIGQIDTKSGEILEKIYKEFGGVVFRSSIETAEFMKYVHNCFNATKISFSNEIWLLSQKLGIDANAALKMASISAEGFWNPEYGTIGGNPYGGACLPKDTKGLLSFARENEFYMPLLSAVDSINTHMENLFNEENAKKISPMLIAHIKPRNYDTHRYENNSKL